MISGILLQKLKARSRKAWERWLLPRPEVFLPTERLGSDYGGWEVVTGQLDADAVVYSFGIGEDASFDIALIEKFGLTVHAFDPTPKSLAWVKRQGFPDRFVLHEFGIADSDGAVSFHPPENPDHVSCTILDRAATRHQAISVPVKRLSGIMAILGHPSLDLLKMDVEGAEYGVIEDLAKSGIRPRQLLVEFHYRFAGVGIFRTRKAAGTLRSMGYALFSVSPSGEEFGFIRREIPGEAGFTT